ncbi:MAG: efflux RND transporter periplasmic adaptor subunit [Nitrospinae bacterium]|nr:efflux RND transporter periplasmic adaptor subunit [Nitrospinota bacterium]MBF0634905.1 efflux RND transporter periplasmic adaptor subunit [Nitrospinota bacterium]
MSGESGKNYTFKFVLTLALAVMIGAGYVYRHSIMSVFTGSHAEKMAATPEATPAKKERKILYWHDPMLADFRSDKPGKSPMGMDLIPKYADDENEADAKGTVRIDSAAMQNIGVRTDVARTRTLSKTIRTVGVVTYDETKLSKIQSKVPGWVEKLYVNATGLNVANDTILLELYSPDLVTTQEEYLLALNYRDSLKQSASESVVKGGEQLLASSLRRLELFDVPRHQIEELTSERKVKKTLHIHSPVVGVVVKKDVTQGMYIEPNMTLYEIADLSTVWVNADIFEYEIPYVRQGQHAVMTLGSIPGRQFEGRITYIYPYLDPQSRSVKVRFEFPNPKHSLKPEMYGDVTIHSGDTKSVVAIPSEAILRTGLSALVFVDRGEGRFEPREVKTGMQSEGFTEIISGVADGEKVVVSAQFLIDSESKLKEAVGKMTGHDHGSMVGAEKKPSNEHKGHTQPADEHAGHAMPADEHAGHTAPPAGDGGAHAGH